jgi:hypothetical protein
MLRYKDVLTLWEVGNPLFNPLLPSIKVATLQCLPHTDTGTNTRGGRNPLIAPPMPI